LSETPAEARDSISGWRLKRVFSFYAAFFALPMSGAKENMAPAAWAPNMIAEKQMKNSRFVYSPFANKWPPYQKPNPM
jgi:hypothetical protein